MLLVKAGRHTLNLDHIAAFVDEDDGVTVIFDFAVERGEAPYSIRLDGEAAERLRSWIRKNAEGVRQEAPGFSVLSQAE